MVPRHAFVLTRLNPQTTARMGDMSDQVIQVAESWTTHPALALVIALEESHPVYRWDYRSVFYPLSPTKPTGNFSNYHVRIQFLSTGQARLLLPEDPNPPDQLSDVLYVQTVPPLFQTLTLPSHALPQQLDSVSLEHFAALAADHMCAALQASFRLRKSGGEEVVQKSWDAWSYDPLSIESLQAPPLYTHFDYLNPEGIDLSALELPRIMEDLIIFKTLVEDYSWHRVSHVASWCIESRRVSPVVPMLPYSIESIARSQVLDSETIECLAGLYRMRAPVNRHVHSAEVDEDWEPPNPVYRSGFNSCPPLSASNIQVVVFDPIGTIFDRQASILRALRSLGLPETNYRDDDILGVYIEFESLLQHGNPQWALDQVVERAIQDTFVHFSGRSMRFDPSLLEVARGDLLRLSLYPDAVKTVEALAAQGIVVVGLSVPAAGSFCRPQLPSPFVVDSFPQPISALYVTHDELFTGLFERLQSLCGALEKQEQVLIVTSGRVRVLESARLADYPTALIQHNFESRVEIGPHACKPTLTVPDLNGLTKTLLASRDILLDAKPEADSCGMRALFYDARDIIGQGGFGEVWDGIHVLSGRAVAIKHDEPEYADEEHVCETNLHSCSFPYEAQVYKVLRGAPGFPSLRYFFLQGSVHVLVLEKLGPDLEAIRRLCRGTLSLKTVLMLGLQMLERIAFMHSRGLMLRDIKPDNFALGLGEHSLIVHMFDFGLVMPYVNQTTGEHIPYAEGLKRVGTPRYSSYNMLMERETSRRDDIEGLGYVLLYLLHGRLPWQGIYAPSIEDKFVRITEMRVGGAMQDFIDESPGRDLWHAFFKHARELAFTEKPDYDFLKGIMLKQIGECGGLDWKYDWLDGGVLEYGTLVPEEYKFDARVFKDANDLQALIPKSISRYFEVPRSSIV